MRALWLAAAVIAAFTTALLAPPAGGAASSPFSITSTSAAAGTDEVFTVTRTSGGKGIYVLFQTFDGTAHAGTDYTAVQQLLYFRASQVSATVVVHTAVNSAAIGTLTFTASIAASSVPARATGSIVEPPPPPPPATQTCPDGSVIPAAQTCPVAPPPPPTSTAWVLTGQGPQVGGYAWLKNQGPCCNGLIVKIVDGGVTNDADPALRQHWWTFVYYADPSGNFPATTPYWATAWMTGFDDGLQGVAPQ